MVVAASTCLITMVGIFVFEATKLGDDLNKLISTNIHNPDLVDEHSS